MATILVKAKMGNSARMPYGWAINATVCAVEKFSPAKRVTINVR